jgi:translation initiation factor 2B subunit (eIF-2B alpha/beta/delta family)
MLIGTHGILEKHSLLCKAGTHSLVLTGKAHDVPVIAFSSTDKFLQNGSREKDIVGDGYLAPEIPKEVDENHTVLCTWSKMDKIPIELADSFVTEEGVKPQVKKTPTSKRKAPAKS